MASSYKKTIVLGLDYSDFKGGVQECNDKMKLLDAEFAHANAQMEQNGTQSQKTATKMDYLTNKIQIQQQKVENAKKKYDALMDAQADTSKIDKADAALLRERTTLINLQKELDATKLAESGLKESLVATAAVLTGLGATFISCAKGAADYADEILTLSNNTGVSTQTLQEWEYAADFIDVSVDQMTGAMTKMVSNMSKAKDGSGEAAKAFAMLGVKITDSKGQMRDSEDVFLEAIDVLGQIQNKTKQDQIAMTLFGKSAQDLSGLIAVGSKGLEEYAEEARKLGVVMSDDQLLVAGDAKNAFDKFNDTMVALKNNLGVAVLPIITELINAIASIPVPVLTTIATVLTIVTTLVTLTKTINSVVKAGSAIGTMFDMMTSKVSMTTVAIIGAVAAITALISAYAVATGKGNELQNVFTSMGHAISGFNGYQRRPGYNASGTSSWRGGETWVGENGPELVSLPRGTTIYNNNESRSIAGNTYNISMNMDITKLRSVNDVVEAVQGLASSAECGVV